MREEYPDARFVVALATEEGDDLEKGLDRLNPILKEILIGRSVPKPGDALGSRSKFGRLTFSSN